MRRREPTGKWVAYYERVGVYKKIPTRAERKKIKTARSPKKSLRERTEEFLEIMQLREGHLSSHRLARQCDFLKVTSMWDSLGTESLSFHQDVWGPGKRPLSTNLKRGAPWVSVPLDGNIRHLLGSHFLQPGDGTIAPAGQIIFHIHPAGWSFESTVPHAQPMDTGS